MAFAGCPTDVLHETLGRRFSVCGFLSHLHSLMVTMSQKSSLPQAAKSVSQALMSDNLPCEATPHLSALTHKLSGGTLRRVDGLRLGQRDVRRIHSRRERAERATHFARCRHRVLRVAWRRSNVTARCFATIQYRGPLSG